MIVATPVTPREGADALQSCSLPILHIYFTYKIPIFASSSLLKTIFCIEQK